MKRDVAAFGPIVCVLGLLITYDWYGQCNSRLGIFAATLICLLWLITSILRSAITRPGWKVALVRVLLPSATLVVVFLNTGYQNRILSRNAEVIASALERYYHDHDLLYPSDIAQLVPTYLTHVPPANYCCLNGCPYEYSRVMNNTPMLVYWIDPPFGRLVYRFVERDWNHVD